MLYRIVNGAITLGNNTYELNDKNLLVIECEGSVYKLSTMNADEFPMLPNIDVEKSISVSQGALKEMIKKTIFAVSQNEARKPILTGSLFEIETGVLSVVSTLSGSNLLNSANV